MSKFVVSEPLVRYTGAGAIRELDALLKLNADNTSVVRVSRIEQVTLDKTGQVGGKYRFTASAMQDMLNTAVPRLGPAVRNIYMEGTDDRLKTVPFVSDWINRVVRQRFGRLLRSQMIIDTRQQHIVGFVGPRYRRLCNRVFMEKVKDTCDGLPNRPRLFEASLKGRRLSVACVGNVKVQAGDVTLHQGVFAQNGETGDRAVRLAHLVFVTSSRHVLGYMLSDFHAKARVPHIAGRKFDEKLAVAFDFLGQGLPDDTDIVRQIATLKRSVVGKTKTVSEAKQAKDLLTTRLRAGNVFPDQASKVADAAIKSGRPLSKWDVVIACLQIASATEGDAAIPTQQFAYRLVFADLTKSGARK